MSQIQSFLESAGPGPGPILSLTGDVGPAVGPDPITGNINIDMAGTLNYGFGIVATQATYENNLPFPVNTLQIQPLADKVQTVDASLVNFPLANKALLASQAVVMTANIIGHRDDFSASCGGFVTGVARRAAAGGSVLVGFEPLMSRDVAGPTFGFQLNGNSLNLYAQGIAGQTWNWTCTFTYQLNLN